MLVRDLKDFLDLTHNLIIDIGGTYYHVTFILQLLFRLSYSFSAIRVTHLIQTIICPMMSFKIAY